MAQKISYIIGAVVAILGIVGFFNDPILGIFEVDAVHNIILIVAGLVLLGTAAAGAEMAVMWTKIVGVVVAIIAVLGFIPPTDTVVGIAETNIASGALQIIVAIALLWAGFAGKSGGSMDDSMGGGGAPQQPQQPMGGGQPEGGQSMDMGGQGGPGQGRQ